MNRQREESTATSAVTCLECDRKITLSSKAEVGDIIACPSCDSEYEIVALRPARIEWAYDDYDDDYDDYDDDDD